MHIRRCAKSSAAGCTRIGKASTGSSTCVSRVVLLETPASLDLGETTDKGSINQRAVLQHRAGLVDDLYANPLPPHVIAAEGE